MVAKWETLECPFLPGRHHGYTLGQVVPTSDDESGKARATSASQRTRAAVGEHFCERTDDIQDCDVECARRTGARRAVRR